MVLELVTLYLFENYRTILNKNNKKSSANAFVLCFAVHNKFYYR